MSVHEEEVLGKAYDSRLMRRLLSYLKPYRFFVTLAVLILFAASVLQLAGPYRYKIAIDKYIETQDFDGLASICLVFAFVLIVGFVMQFLQTYLVQWIGQKAMYDLRSAIFSHIQKLPVKFLIKIQSGDWSRV